MAMRGIWMIAGLLGLALARPVLAQVPEPLPPEAVEASPVATAPAQVPPPAEIDGVPALTQADAEAWLDGFMPYALAARSEEHTSELQSLMCISYAVFFLKKKISALVINTSPTTRLEVPTLKPHRLKTT